MNDLHSAIGSYVADALSPVERADFETHLSGCISCRLEVAEFTETLAELTPLVATRPPAALRDSVLAAIKTVQPLAPEIVVRSEERARRRAVNGSPDPLPLQPAAVTELRPLGPDEVAPLDEHPSEVPDWTWLGVTAGLSDDVDARRARRTDRLLAVLVAAALVVALAFSGWVYVSWQANQTQTSQAQQETDLLTAPDAKVITAKLSGTNTPVSFVVSKRRNEALFIASNLADPGANTTYQLWTLKGDAATQAGLVRQGGSVRQWIRGGPVGDADGLAISREPGPSGSSKPSTILARVHL